MEQILRYLPDLPAPVLVVIFGLVMTMKIDKKLKDVPTFKDTENIYSRRDMCQQRHLAEEALRKEVHKSINEKLNCIPEIQETVTKIKTTVDLILKNGNGK